MAVSVPDPLKTYAAGSAVDVTWYLLVDWDDAGFASQGSWYDESAHIVNVDSRMEAVGWDSSLSAVGNASISYTRVLLDSPLTGSNRRFWLVNPSGTLYSKLGNGAIKYKRAIVKAVFRSGGTTWRVPVVTGYITAAQDYASGKQMEITVTDRSADCEMTTVNTGLESSSFAYTYVKTLTDLMTRDRVNWGEGYGYGTPYVDAGFFPILYAWADDEKLWDELSSLAESQMGRVWFDREGNFHFEDASHWVRPRSETNRDPRVSQATISTADGSSCDAIYQLRSHYSHINITYTPRYLAEVTEVYSTPDVWMVPPASSGTFYAEFRHPVWSVETPVINEDYTVCSSGGVDMSSDVTVTFTFAATRATIVATNASTTAAALVTGMSIRGQPCVPRQACKYEVSDPAAVHKTTWKVSNAYIQHYRHAQAVGDFALARFAGHVAAVKLAEVRCMPWLEIGDRITVTGPNIDPAKQDHFITRINFGGGQNRAPVMEIEAIRAADLFPLEDYFFMGDGSATASKYGQLGDHGHLFY